MKTRVSTCLALTLSLFAAASPAGAQARKPAPKRAEQPPPPPPLYPCRTAEEICFLGIVMGDKVAVVFTNAPNAKGIDEKPVEVTGDSGKIDLSKDDGRVVMLTGSFDPKAGLTKAAVVEVASPLASLIVKAQIAGQQPDGPPPQGGARRR